MKMEMNRMLRFKSIINFLIIKLNNNNDLSIRYLQKKKIVSLCLLYCNAICLFQFFFFVIMYRSSIMLLTHKY